MKRTLYFKLLGGYLLFALLCFLAITLFTYQATYEKIQVQTASDLYREANAVSSTYATNYYSHMLDLDDFQMHLSILSRYSDATIWIMDVKGTILLDSSNKYSPNTPIVGYEILDFGNNYYRTGTFYDFFPEEMISVYSSITVGYKVKGYVVIHKPIQSIVDASNIFTTIHYQTLAWILLAAFFVLVLFTLIIYVPLHKLAKAANSYAHGNFDNSAAIHTNDEIGSLAASLNYMAKELHTLEDDQKKFISNVSHDFRSPLTSIKGYVEAMLDGTIPVEMQDKYLNIILFETDRLNKLTHSLLELNKFGSRGIMLDISTFDINQTIRTTVQTFEGACTKKQLSFDLTLTGDELLIHADYGKIQQVLYNLIDNAIKFSHPNATIYIETTTRNEKVFVSIKDTGIGIPKDSIHKIWERFYKSDLSRGKDKKGTGLGLAIVKEIISAHNENINCISTEGVGTEFIFTLPLSED